MRTGFWRLAALTVAVTLTAGGCGSSSPKISKADDHGVVGVVMPSTTLQRWALDGANIQLQLQTLGYSADLRYADDSAPRQVDQIAAMVNKHVKALVIASVDGSALADVLAKAADQNIPVIAYDRLILNTPNVGYYATFDNFKVGVLQANTIVAKLGLEKDRVKGPFTLEMFAGSPDDNNATVFYKGAMSVLKPYLDSGKLTVRSGQQDFDQIATKGWTDKIAQARMTKLLARYSTTKLDAVLSPNDGLARGILTALGDAGYGGADKPLPVVTGQDADLDSVKLLMSGKQTSTVYKDTRELAKVAVRMADTLIHGGTPEVNDTSQYDNGAKTVPTFLLQPVSVDRSNYDRILVGGGYYTEGQLHG